MAFKTSASVTCKAGSVSGAGIDFLTWAALGCLSVSFVNVSSLSKAGLSSEQIMRIAALILPSSIFDVTAAVIEWVALDLLYYYYYYSF